MVTLYNIIFFGTYLIVAKVDKTEAESSGLYQALSAVLCLVVSHFLFVFSFVILVLPEYSNFDLKSILFIILVLFAIFIFAFVRAGRYRKIAEEYKHKQKKSLVVSAFVNGVMLFTFFIMASKEIISTI